jgi:hypothetical protein
MSYMCDHCNPCTVLHDPIFLVLLPRYAVDLSKFGLRRYEFSTYVTPAAFLRGFQKPVVCPAKEDLQAHEAICLNLRGSVSIVLHVFSRMWLTPES